jgi:hypothetical protein
MPKVSPNLAIVCAMAEAKYVDAGPALYFTCGRLLPNDATVVSDLKFRAVQDQMDLYGPVRGGVTWLADDLTRAVRRRIHLS